MAKNYYLKPEVLRAHWDACVKAGECSNELIKDFRLIADNVYVVITKGQHHQDAEVCKVYAVTEAWRKWDKFDPSKTENIFAFFTQMIKNDIMIHYNYLNGNKRNISMTLFEEGDKDD